MNLLINNRYKLQTKIGEGAFGQVYVGMDTETNEQVAVKLENRDMKPPQLTYESKMYQLLANQPGFPSTSYFGSAGDFNVLVIELLGPSLEDCMRMCGGSYTLKCVCMMAQQIISRLEFLHNKTFMHRDQKPDNYCIGRGRKRTSIYLIDYGLSKRFIVGGSHIPYKEKKPMIGTVRYCSINSQNGIEQSRRDDLESLGYILVYLVKGQLPWQGIKAATKKEKYDKIQQKKVATPLDALCRGIPQEFASFIQYCRLLKFEDKPDYPYLKKLFQDLMISQGFKDDQIYDWVEQGLDTDRFYEQKLKKKNSVNDEEEEQDEGAYQPVEAPDKHPIRGDDSLMPQGSKFPSAVGQDEFGFNFGSPQPLTQQNSVKQKPGSGGYDSFLPQLGNARGSASPSRPMKPTRNVNLDFMF